MLEQNDRLTHEHANGWFSSTGRSGQSRYWTNATKTQLMERLAAYENTRLTPEEIQALQRKTHDTPSQR